MTHASCFIHRSRRYKVYRIRRHSASACLYILSSMASHFAHASFKYDISVCLVLAVFRINNWIFLCHCKNDVRNDCSTFFLKGCIQKLSEYIEEHLLVLGSVGLGVSILQVSTRWNYGCLELFLFRVDTWVVYHWRKDSGNTGYKINRTLTHLWSTCSENY